jgi:hypothetical protein
MVLVSAVLEDFPEEGTCVYRTTKLDLSSLVVFKIPTITVAGSVSL